MATGSVSLSAGQSDENSPGDCLDTPAALPVCHTRDLTGWDHGEEGGRLEEAEKGTLRTHGPAASQER